MLNSGDFLTARDHLHRALLQARRAGNVKLRAETHYLLGKVDWKEADFEGANYNRGRAARMAEETSDAMLRGRVQMQQALLLYTEGKLKEAIPVYQAAIPTTRIHGQRPAVAQSLQQPFARVDAIGIVVDDCEVIEDRLRLAREYRLAKAEAVALTDMAELKLLQGDLPAAERAIEESLSRHGQTVYARTQRIRGRILLARRRCAEAIESLEKGRRRARQPGDRGAGAHRFRTGAGAGRRRRPGEGQGTARGGGSHDPARPGVEPDGPRALHAGRYSRQGPGAERSQPLHGAKPLDFSNHRRPLPRGPLP